MLASKTWVAMLHFSEWVRNKSVNFVRPSCFCFLPSCWSCCFCPASHKCATCETVGHSAILCGQSQVKHQNAGGKPCRTTSGRQASQHPAAKARKERLRHTQTAWQWRAERASGRRPVLPNVAFWSYEKLAIFLLLPLLSPDHCPIQKLYLIQKLRFRNYCTRFRNYDSETIFRVIQKLRFRNHFVRFRSYDSETISCDSKTRILKLFCAIQENYDFNIMDHAFILAYTTSKLPPTLAETWWDMHFYVDQQARQTSSPLWTTRSYLQYSTPPLLASTCIFTFMNEHV